MADSLAAGGRERTGAAELRERGFAVAKTARVTDGDQKLRGSQGPDPILAEEIGCEPTHECLDRAVDLVELAGEVCHPRRRPAQGSDGGAALTVATTQAQTEAAASQLRGGATAETLTEVRWCSESQRLQLVACVGQRFPRPSTLDQQDAQLLAVTAAARHRQPLARQQLLRGKIGIERIRLSVTTLLPLGPLDLVNEIGRLDQDSDQAGAVGGRPLDRECRLAEGLRPRDQRGVTLSIRRNPR